MRANNNDSGTRVRRTTLAQPDLDFAALVEQPSRSHHFAGTVARMAIEVCQSDDVSVVLGKPCWKSSRHGRGNSSVHERKSNGEVERAVRQYMGAG